MWSCLFSPGRVIVRRPHIPDLDLSVPLIHPLTTDARRVPSGAEATLLNRPEWPCRLRHRLASQGVVRPAPPSSPPHSSACRRGLSSMVLPLSYRSARRSPCRRRRLNDDHRRPCIACNRAARCESPRRGCRRTDRVKDVSKQPLDDDHWRPFRDLPNAHLAPRTRGWRRGRCRLTSRFGRGP